MLPELTLAQMIELTPAEIARNVYAYPTLSEVLMEAAHDVEGHATHICSLTKTWMRTPHS